MALTGLTALALAGSPALAIGTVDPVVRPAPQDEVCGKSSNSVQQLSMIEKPGDDNFQCLSLMLDGDTVTALRLETHRFASAPRRADAQRVEVTVFPLAVVESRRGAVLDGVPGHDAIILRGSISASSRKAELVASYLYNGFTSEYRSCPITLDRTPERGWRLINRFDQTISRIVVRTRDMLVIPFGIADLEGACTQRTP
jgi:hypothetical protein